MGIADQISQEDKICTLKKVVRLALSSGLEPAIDRKLSELEPESESVEMLQAQTQHGLSL